MSQAYTPITLELYRYLLSISIREPDCLERLRKESSGHPLAFLQALPPDGRLVTLDINRTWTEVARRHWRDAGVEDRIEWRLSPALVELERLKGEGAVFDMAFLDADKRNYPAYYELILALLRPGGLLVADNVLWSGRAAQPEGRDHDSLGIHQFNAQLAKDPRVDLSTLPFADGLTLALKRRDV